MPLGNEGDGVRLILHGYNSGDLFQIPKRKDTPRGKRYSFILFSIARFIFPFVQCVYHMRGKDCREVAAGSWKHSISSGGRTKDRSGGTMVKDGTSTAGGRSREGRCPRGEGPGRKRQLLGAEAYRCKCNLLLSFTAAASGRNHGCSPGRHSQGGGPGSCCRGGNLMWPGGTGKERGKELHSSPGERHGGRNGYQFTCCVAIAL